MTLYMGCNDMTSAEYFAKKCGKVTISVTNNQFPLAPLFSPITVRPVHTRRPAAILSEIFSSPMNSYGWTSLSAL